MRIGEIVTFRKDLYFEGAVQADWFYTKEKAAKVAENFVFHGKDYFGIESESKAKKIDTVSLVGALSKKLCDEASNPLTLAIADYGTGKSHLAVTLAQLFSGAAYMPETHNNILQNIRRIDASASEEITRNCADNNFVMVINGMKDFNLHYEILRAAQKSLQLYGLSDEKLRRLNRTVETASLFFERNISSQLTLFEQCASERGWTECGESLIARIRDSLMTDEVAFDIINAAYSQINGKEISWDEGISARSILEMLLAEYCGLNGRFDHVIILFDEFGRYLEYASGSDAGKSGDSALQQIFEVAQDADGALQVINFIQSDIKTYLVRVDQTRNISRYIGRYDQSEKYYISSNLETVFANLIYRQNKDAFEQTIVKWQDNSETLWKDIYSKMNRWLSLNGVWGNYDLYRKVIVEGIYPMHPLSTYMLTQLSDYLQNRSSMTLISHYIDSIANYDIEDGVPLIMPEELMKGDLYQEMLSSEINGKQLSQHCIRYDNILRKQGDKLTEGSLSVLRANLIVRILRFKTRDYNDAKEALMLCSGLSASQLGDELQLLENEYAVLGFDEHAGCFDFMEDSRGAHEYKIKKKRLAATWHADFRVMFKTAKILELGEVSELQETAFGTNHKILTNEWKYAQEVLMAEDVTESLAMSYLKGWKDSRSATIPKGRLIWAYVNKDTEYSTLDNLQRIASLLLETPIVIMLLNDAENRLFNALTNYDLIDRMDDSIRQTYARAYSDDLRQAEEIVQNEFDALKKQRERVCKDSVIPMKKRLQMALTDVFEDLYPNAVSFNFDGLLTASNNFTGKGSSYYCQIMKMLLSNNVSFDTIHDFPSDVRSKISSVLMESGATAWKCISNSYSIMPPADDSARRIYDETVDALYTNKSYDCITFINRYCYPPYGMSEEAAILMLAVILANNSYCIRIKYNHSQNAITKWKEDVIVNDKKIDFDLIRASEFVLIDTDAIEARFQQLFNRLNATMYLDEVITLQRDIEAYAENNGVPESLAINYRLAQSRFETAGRAKKEWNTNIAKAEDQLEEADAQGNVYNALLALEAIEEIPIYSIFEDNGFSMSDDDKAVIRELSDKSHHIVDYYFDTWLAGTIHCKSVEAMTQFEKHIKRCNEKLVRFGFTKYASRLVTQGQSELTKKDEIRSRQELLADGQKFLAAYKKISFNNYTDITDMLNKANDLVDRLKMFELSLGNDAKKLHSKLDECIGRLSSSQKRIQEDMSNIWDDLAGAQTLEDIKSVQSCLAMVMNYRIAARDLRDFDDLKTVLDLFVSDLDSLQSAVRNRETLRQTIEELRDKYSDSEMDFDVCTVLEDEIHRAEEAIDTKDIAWRNKYLTLGDRSRETIHTWKENTRVLPCYLSQDTITAVEQMRQEADQLISDAMIDDVVFYFKKLNADERKHCLDLLLMQA